MNIIKWKMQPKNYVNIIEIHALNDSDIKDITILDKTKDKIFENNLLEIKGINNDLYAHCFKEKLITKNPFMISIFNITMFFKDTGEAFYFKLKYNIGE